MYIIEIIEGPLNGCVCVCVCVCIIEILGFCVVILGHHTDPRSSTATG